MKLPNKYKVIGLMSGTSLDGLDIVCCEFIYKNPQWEFKIIHSETKKYTPLWRKKLSQAHLTSGRELIALDYEYGKFIGSACHKFLQNKHIDNNIDLIASHGHTVFHQPRQGVTYQLGNGNAIYAQTGIPVINDFRSLDVLYGGEGAPLASVGDTLLFGDYSVCLNLGGIANISIKKGNIRTSYDVCFANMGLNYLAGKTGKIYDKDGKIASKGVIDSPLLKKLNTLFDQPQRKKASLGREGFEQSLRPVLEQAAVSIADKMCTLCEFIAIKISQQIPPSKGKSLNMLVTGGGAFNAFLIHRLKIKVAHKAHVVIPDKSVVAFKEAIIFALLGILRIRGDINVLSQVTGSRQNSSAGCITGGSYIKKTSQ